jgi:hypothetical protein
VKTNWRNQWILTVALAFLVACVSSTASQSEAEEVSHASGLIAWVQMYEEHGDDWNETWGQGTEGIMRVRMERNGAEWVDAGSTFHAQYQSWRAPHANYPGLPLDCTMLKEEIWWPAPRSRFDAIDPPTGFVPSSIALEIGAEEGVASIYATMSGGPYSVTTVLEGADCGDREPTDEGGISCTDTTCVLQWDSQSAPVAEPGCPLSLQTPGFAGLVGELDDAGRSIDFNCLSTRQGTTESGEASYREIARVAGSVRLSP